MLIDTHCHLNMIIKKKFDTLLNQEELEIAQNYIVDAEKNGVNIIINVGTSLEESLNSIKLAKKYENVFATIGIHPNDLKSNWKKELDNLAKKIIPENKIVGIGECGMDKHYPEYNLQRQTDGFKTQIELALEKDLGLVVHTREAPDETLKILEEYKNDIKRGIIHCFSEDLEFAELVTSWNFCIGLGGTITYPKNERLREVAQKIPLEKIVLETDAPFLAPQVIRGKLNTPKEILTIAQYIADLKNIDLKEVADKTTKNAKFIFNLN